MNVKTVVDRVVDLSSWIKALVNLAVPNSRTLENNALTAFNIQHMKKLCELFLNAIITSRN